MKLKAAVATILTVLNLIMPFSVEAQTLRKAGATVGGVLYVDIDSVQTVKKDAKYYLAVSAEEKYTDASFLYALRQNKGLEKAAGAIHLYLFDNYGKSYCVAASYLIDEAGSVVVNLGSEMTPVQIGKDKTLLNAYTMALKALENKQRWRGKY